MALGAHAHDEDARAGGLAYERRRPEETVLYGVVQRELETFLAQARSRERAVPRFVERELRAYLRCGILAHGFARVHCDAVTFVQRFGDALNLNLHFHSLLLDGIYATSPTGRPRFHPLPPPDDAEVARVAGQVAARIARLLERRGLGPDADPSDADPLSEEEPLLAQLYGASVASRVATGRRAGQPVIRGGDCIDPDALPELASERCASAGAWFPRGRRLSSRETRRRGSASRWRAQGEGQTVPLGQARATRPEPAPSPKPRPGGSWRRA